MFYSQQIKCRKKETMAAEDEIELVSELIKNSALLMNFEEENKNANLVI